MTKVVMLQTRKGTDDCLNVRQFVKGETYNVSYLNAVYMISRGWAVEDLYSNIKDAIESTNSTYGNKSEKLRNFWNQFQIDRILNSNLEEAKKIELLLLTKPKAEVQK